MKIVILDGFTTNPGDLDWNKIESLGETVIWPRTSDEELMERAREADVLVVNKRILSKEELCQLPDVKCICTLATGYNNVDIEYCSKNGITVCNAVGYSSTSVAQHVFSMILHHYSNLHDYVNAVNEGKWFSSKDFSFYTKPLTEVSGKSIGIYGYGKIGQTVGSIARAFGMNINVLSRGIQKDFHTDVSYLSEKNFFSSSDIISLHAPLSSVNEGYINSERLNLMKSSSILINTGRGGLVNENDLKTALIEKVIAAAYLDVLSEEPPSSDHVLMNVERCHITPHIAWAAKESRGRLIQTVADNIRAFKKGSPQNVVS